MSSAIPLKPPTRVITTHDANGKAIISTAMPEQPKAQVVSNGDASFFLGYATDQYPVDLNKDKDLTAYQHYASQPPGLVISGGIVLRYVDMAPGITPPMHRTVWLDYGIVIEGEIELILDSGETRRVFPGDMLSCKEALCTPGGTCLAKNMRGCCMYCRNVSRFASGARH